MNYERDSLYDRIWDILEEELGDTIVTDRITDAICDIVMDWCPKKGDFWLNRDDDFLYVNKGWEIVCAEAPEVTPKENERRFKEAMRLIKGVTHEQLVELMGEEWLEEFRRVAQGGERAVNRPRSPVNRPLLRP